MHPEKFKPISKRRKVSPSQSDSSSKSTVTALQKQLESAERWKDSIVYHRLMWDLSCAHQQHIAIHCIYSSYFGAMRFLYTQRGCLTCTQSSRRSFQVWVDELKFFFAIQLASGYKSLPRRDMYWSTDANLHNDCCQETDLEKLCGIYTFFDNSNLPDNDKYVLVTNPNEQFAMFLPSDVFNMNADESIVSYYSHHSCNQRIQGKPIRYGFQLWRLSSRRRIWRT